MVPAMISPQSQGLRAPSESESVARDAAHIRTEGWFLLFGATGVATSPTGQLALRTRRQHTAQHLDIQNQVLRSHNVCPA